MPDTLDFNTFGKVKFINNVPPTTSETNAQIDDLFVDSATGVHYVCIDDTPAAQSWLGSDGSVVPIAILATDHPDLVAMYTMDNISGSTLNDESPNTNNATISGPTADTGYINNALRFTGTTTTSGDVVDSSAQLLPSTGDFSCCGWVKADNHATGSEQVFVGQYPDKVSAVTGRCAIKYNGTGVFQFFVSGTSMTGVQSSGGWDFVYLERSGNTFTVRLNDTSEDSLVYTGSLYAGHTDLGGMSNRNKTVGGDPYISNPLIGLLDHWRFFNRVLTSAEKTALYNEGTP